MASSPRASDPTEAPRRIRLEADDRRERILVAAQRLFAERPYSAVSTTELATVAGTTRTNLHYYFRTKRDLYIEVLRRFGRLAALPVGTERVTTGPQELSRLFARWLDVLERNPQTIMTMIATAAPSADPEVEAAFREGLEAWEDRLLAVLDLPGDPKSRARIRSFQGMVTAAIAEWLHRGILTKADVHALLTETLVGLADRARTGS